MEMPRSSLHPPNIHGIWMILQYDQFEDDRQHPFPWARRSKA